MDTTEKIYYHFHSILANQYWSKLIVVPVGKVHCKGIEDEKEVE